MDLSSHGVFGLNSQKSLLKINLFNTYLLKIYYVPGTFLGTGEKAVHKIESWHSLIFHSRVRRMESINREKNCNMSGGDKFYKDNEDSMVGALLDREMNQYYLHMEGDVLEAGANESLS